MKPFLWILLLSFVCTSCGDYRYVPMTVKPTFFKEKGDLEVSFQARGMGEFHAAYAITNNIALSATTGWRNMVPDTTVKLDSNNNALNRFIEGKGDRDNELAIGYFKCFDDGSTFEVYGGYAIANQIIKRKFSDFVNPNNSFNIRENNLNYGRFFIQPAYGKSTKIADYGFANRFTILNFHPDAKNDFISESMFFFRFGYKYVKVMWQFGFTLSNVNNTYDYLPFNAGIGLYFQLNHYD